MRIKFSRQNSFRKLRTYRGCEISALNTKWRQTACTQRSRLQRN